ncbi:hypothetical protein [Sphingomonas sp. 10B4]|uniref:hypothetical protein n=1 Tax=Sphingomonas sp. 10B4 TaxID=3048575 RepID=UPI002AB32DF2|nr:hypothetical protein [Sphingomonas sp. 10B4]MDY7525503.1 hypothetical protein [Sphingomonas sp. 10B4]MEB0281448.1 hypothetical protein [Sphingomonas sp. 10B4]
MEREQARVEAILRRDRAGTKTERKRREALAEVKEGKFGNLADTAMQPTPELLRTGEFAPYTPDKTDGTIRTVPTLRRVQHSRIIALHKRGVLDDDTFPACLWYRKAWEGCGFDLSPTAAAWGEQIPGEKAYGHGGKTPAQVEARQNFRFAAAFIPDDMRKTFDLVVLEEFTIADAAREARCRYTNVTVMLKLAAYLLRGGIGHVLPTREVGVPGCQPHAQISPPEPAGSVPEPRPDLDPRYLDERGYMRPYAEIKVLLLGGVLDEGEAA